MVDTYYICFMKGQYFLYRWHLIKKGFGHVIVFKKLADDVYYVLHPSIRILFTGFSVFKSSTEKEFVEICKEKFKEKQLHKILKVNLDLKSLGQKKNRLFFNPFNFINCVSFTKYLCGIFNPFILTPYQLYKYLLKHRDAIDC